METPRVPSLSRAEWLLFAALAAILAVANLYTTLLTGWADGGSIVAVVVAVIALRALGKSPSVRAINLGQTMASAGGTVGFSAAAYAAVSMADPSFSMSPISLVLLFLALAIAGTLIGAAIRSSVVRYHFPSGTACALIQKSAVSASESRRSMRLLTVSGVIAALVTIPGKISVSSGGAAVLSRLPLGSVGGQKVAVSLDPLLVGVGLVAGMRIASGLLIGSLVATFALPTWLASGGVAEDAFGDWMTWIAIAILTLPTFVAILLARRLREPVSTPPGFEPGRTDYKAAAGDRRRAAVLAALAVAVAIAITALAFEVVWYWAAVAAAVSGPLCLVNGRITADTDINPVILVVIVLLTGFALVGGLDAVMLLGLALVGSTVVGIAVDMMQDYRTGYLLDENPNHQTIVQIVGSVIGVLVAVPVLLVLESELGFGPERGLAAPGPRIYTGLATGLSASSGGLSTELMVVVALVSVAASVVAVLTVWSRTARFTPSLFGVGMGILLPMEMTAAVTIGALVRWGVTASARGGESSDAASDREGDVVLVGSSIFAASALATVAILGLVLAFHALGLRWIDFAG